MVMEINEYNNEDKNLYKNICADYWKCHCEKYFLHEKDDDICPICGANKSECESPETDDSIGIEESMYKNRRITIDYESNSKDRIVMRFEPNDDIYMRVNGITMRMDDPMFLSFSLDEADIFWHRLYVFFEVFGGV